MHDAPKPNPCISFNGRQRTVPNGTTIAELLSMENIPSRGVATAVNAEIVTRSSWSTYILTAGDKVEIVTIAQGG